MAKDKDLTVDDKFELMIEALRSALSAQQPLNAETLREVLAANAHNFQKAMKPENEQHPGISVFSHPEGDLAKPKPPLPYQCFYNGYPIHKFPETESWREWELFAQVTPGEYTVIRRDGSPMRVEVKGETDAVGTLTKVAIEHPILREEKNLVPPKTVLLWQIIHSDNPRKAFVESMQEHIRAMWPDPVPV